MKYIKNLIMSLAIISAVGGSFLTVAAPQTAFAADGSSCGTGFLGFPAWYNGLTDGSCNIQSPSADGLGKFIWTIVLNIIQMALMIVGYLAVGFIIYGGFLLMTSRGKPNEIAEGQITIRNAVIGLTISFGSVAIVRFVADHIIGASDSATGIFKGGANEILGNALGIVYMAGGIIAVISIIIAGYMYTISGGNPSEVEKSKNTILYSVIGLVVIAGAFFITQFVLGRF